MPPPDSPDALNRPAAVSPRFVLFLCAALFAAATFGLSWWCWWTYQYGTFDLAFYVQSLWLALHGQWHVSLLDVPMLGNHAEPIVFLLLPLFALIQHPMLLPSVQVLALATMPFTAWRITQRLGITGWPAAFLSLATLAAPATAFVAMHEFHPEAFSAPLLLLLFEARRARRFSLFCLWFLLCAGCKENIALLLAAWGAVFAWSDRGESWRWQWRWNIGPALAALLWLAFYAFWLSPRINGGRVDYGNLYAHLGNSGPEMVRNVFREPWRIFGAIWQSATRGDLVWAMFLSFALLPLLRPRWLLIAAPIFAQHLLSSRPSEWTIHYHYAAPLIGLFWIASAEALSGTRPPSILACMPLALSLLLQFCLGPFLRVPNDLRTADFALWNRAWKSQAIASIAADPSLRVSAGLPYLSHLACRRELYSLHFILKGLKTLSAVRDDPTYEADAVLIDSSDESTFSLTARYYHPEGQRGAVSLPSSDELLNKFLARDAWIEQSVNSLLILRRGAPQFPANDAPSPMAIGDHAELLQANLVSGAGEGFEILLHWRFSSGRTRIPWLMLSLSDGRTRHPILLGLCAPQIASGEIAERRLVSPPPTVPPGTYQVSGIFFDQIEALWRPKESAVLRVVPFGEVKLGDHSVAPH